MVTDGWIDHNTTDPDECINMLLRAMSAANELHLSLRFPSFKPYTFGYDKGVKYSRVWVDNGTQRFVCFFVERANGDIWKADGWKKPAKNFTRGNIFSPEGRTKFIMEKISDTGYFYHGIG